MLSSTSARPNGRQITLQKSARSPFLVAFAHASPRNTTKKYHPWSEPEEKHTRFYPVREPRPLPSNTKPRYIEGIPVLLLEHPPKTAGRPRRTSRPPPCPRPRAPVQPPSKLRYVDGLPVFPKTASEIATANAAALARQPPVYFRDHTPGWCIHCALTASPCTFTRATPSTPCGRCRRLGLACMIRRPGTARRIVTGDEAGDWVPVQRALEEAVGEDGARALAERAMRESEEDGARAVFGSRFVAKDVRGWCLPRVVGGRGRGGGFWRRVLRIKGEEEGHEETEGVDRSSISELAAEIDKEGGCLHRLEGPPIGNKL
ncbi:hypothetical protein LZ31DRAFT_626878 [Colletotrichum somersetense]|nr:hypothetical protein LZ31DRAFT_626878 [Colletotrichum somersetense]